MIKAINKVHIAYLLVDLILIVAAFFSPYFFKHNTILGFSSGSLSFPNPKEYLFVFLNWSIFVFLFLKRHNLFSTDRSITIPREMWRVFICVFYSSILSGMVIFFAQYKFFSREVFFENACLLFALLSLWRIAKRLLLRDLITKGFHNINVLIIGSSKSSVVFLEEIRKRPWLGFKVVGFLDDTSTSSLMGLPLLGKIKDLSSVIKRYFIEEIIVSESSKNDIFFEVMNLAKKIHTSLRVIPSDFSGPLPILNVTYLGIIPLLTYSERKPDSSVLLLKRLIDLFISVISLFFLSPLFIVIAVLIRMDTRGPVLYLQKRVGLKGRIFNCYKFRSMVSGADNMKTDLLSKNEVKGGVIFKIKEDPRITQIGRVLRRFSFDELPQLFNVFRGDMSLVGPRPPTPDEVSSYADDCMLRLSVKPGITGMAQIKGRSKLTFYQWIRWDQWYVNNWSLGLDLWILWQTIPIVIKGEGAY